MAGAFSDGRRRSPPLPCCPAFRRTLAATSMHKKRIPIAVHATVPCSAYAQQSTKAPYDLAKE